MFPSNSVNSGARGPPYSASHCIKPLAQHAADVPIVLDQQHSAAFPRRPHRTRHAAAGSADHDQIERLAVHLGRPRVAGEPDRFRIRPRRIQSFGRLRGERRNGYGRSHSPFAPRRHRTRRPRSFVPGSRSRVAPRVPPARSRPGRIARRRQRQTRRLRCSNLDIALFARFEAEHAQRPRHAPLEHVFTLVHGDRRRAIRTGDGDGYVGSAIRGGDVDQPHFVPPRLGDSGREPRRFLPLAAMVVVPVGRGPPAAAVSSSATQSPVYAAASSSTTIPAGEGGFSACRAGSPPNPLAA